MKKNEITVSSVKMDKTEEELKNDRMEAEKIAWKSSINVLPLGPQSIAPQYPIPADLKLALELAKDDPKLTDSAREYMKILPCLKNFRDIKPNHYWFLIKLLLYLDHYQCMMDMEQYSLYNQKITPSKYNKNNFIIPVPGLSEDRPSVRSRDMVIITQVDGENSCASEVTFVGDKYIAARASPMFISNFLDDQRFNIYFLYPAHCFNCTHFAVDRVVQYDLLPVLFPTGRPTNKIQKKQKLSWMNENIKSNPEQQQAVIHILARTAFPAPYILFGPPGTGKTSTLVEAIVQILKKNPSNRILVCTPSNAAADEIALRLLKNAVDAHYIHRMYSLSRDGKDISDVLKDCSNFADDSSIYISREILLTKKIVITTLLTCHRLTGYRLRESHFSYVFVDEAGQATEPETLIPFSLMSSSQDSHKGQVHGQIVIAGDPKQLGPSIQSRIAEPLLGCSMLERLMEWEIYRKDKTNKFNPSYVTKLVQNYRCHGAILHIPNILFYDGELKAFGGAHTERAVDWEKLPKSKFPVIFHAVDGKEGRDPHSPSVFNSKEIKTVISYVKDLLGSNLGGRLVRQDEIGIVTPYRLQRQKIHEELKKNDWSDVAVGTVETFQGQEKDVIIMSTVRSVLYSHNGRVHIGFLSNPKRFNVALTRAKALLIVIGNPIVLKVDEYWRSFIHYCEKNGACTGSKSLLQRSFNRSKMHELIGKKHVPVPMWDPDLPFEVVEQAPIVKRAFTLPETDPNRRRRLPRNKFGETECSTENFDSLDYSEVDSFWERMNLQIPSANDHYLIQHGDVDEDDEEDDDEFEMKGIFSEEDGSQVSESASDPSEKPKDSDNSWETCSSSATDRSEKSLNPNTVDKSTISEWSEFLANLKIVDENGGC